MTNPAMVGAGDGVAFEDGPDRGRVFVVRHGTLDFLVGDTVTTIEAGAVVRVPPATRHGYVNRSGRDVDMLVMFSPGGFEELFVKYRSDQDRPTGDGFVVDALRNFATEFET
jgi:mannose-6-phosphate isomerase-like protein (cupin superfamily)